jgi:hypothetical protein
MMNVKKLCPNGSLVQAAIWAAAGAGVVACVVGFVPVAILGAGVAVGAVVVHKATAVKLLREQ